MTCQNTVGQNNLLDIFVKKREKKRQLKVISVNKLSPKTTKP